MPALYIPDATERRINVGPWRKGRTKTVSEISGRWGSCRRVQ